MSGISWVNVLLGVWLTLAPWGLPFNGPAASNSILLGMLVLLFAGAAVFARPDNHLPAGLNLVAGAWLLVSPWALGYTGQPHAMWTHVIAGGVIVVIALIRLGAHGRVPAGPPL